jgi:hypothetical protein
MEAGIAAIDLDGRLFPEQFFLLPAEECEMSRDG